MAKPLKQAAKPKPKPQNVVAQARSKKKAPSGETRRRFWENAKGIGGAIVLFLFLRTFFVEAYRIPSGSMIPTLLIGDWLFVNKLVYGPNIPFTKVNLPGYSEPHRYDVVVFESPTQIDQPWDPNPTLVKRLVGMPGDTLYMRGGKLFINGTPAKPYGTGSAQGTAPDYADPLFDWQKRVALKDSRFGPAPQQPQLDNWGPFVVPPSHYFMMGDNRYCSKDSRYWSFVPRENLRGRPLFVYYSYRPERNADDDSCSSDESDRPLSFITDIRWTRFGHWIR